MPLANYILQPTANTFHVLVTACTAYCLRLTTYDFPLATYYLRHTTYCLLLLLPIIRHAVRPFFHGPLVEIETVR